MTVHLCLVSAEGEVGAELLAGESSFLDTALLFHIEAGRGDGLLG